MSPLNSDHKCGIKDSKEEEPCQSAALRKSHEQVTLRIGQKSGDVISGPEPKPKVSCSICWIIEIIVVFG